MLKKFLNFIFYFISISVFLFSFSVIATTSGQNLFSEKNFQAMKTEPATLLSPTNTRQLKSMLGNKNFDLFRQSMSLMTIEDDQSGYLSISGNVRGLFTIFEGFFRMSKSGNVWIAYLYDNQVHYFTNDKATLQNPPAIMQEWSKRFPDAKWTYKSLR